MTSLNTVRFLVSGILLCTAFQAFADKGGTGDVGSAGIVDTICDVTKICESAAAKEARLKRQRVICERYEIAAKQCDSLGSSHFKSLARLEYSKSNLQKSLEAIKADQSADKVYMGMSAKDGFYYDSNSTYWAAGPSLTAIPGSIFVRNTQEGMEFCEVMNKTVIKCTPKKGSLPKGQELTRINSDTINSGESLLQGKDLWVILGRMAVNGFNITKIDMIMSTPYGQNEASEYEILVEGRDSRGELQERTLNWKVDWYEWGPHTHGMAYQLTK